MQGILASKALGSSTSYDRGVLGASLLIQMAMMGMMLAMGYKIIDNVYDVRLVRQCMWMIPTAFVVSQFWYIFRALREQVDSRLLRDYVAWTQRFFVACAVLFFVFASLTRKA